MNGLMNAETQIPFFSCLCHFFLLAPPTHFCTFCPDLFPFPLFPPLPVPPDRAAGRVLSRLRGRGHRAVSVSTPGRQLAGQRGKHGPHHRGTSR